jgi:hypothetical protein
LDRDIFDKEETRMAKNVQNINGRTIADEDLGEVTRRLKEITEATYLSPEEKAKQHAEVLDEYDLDKAFSKKRMKNMLGKQTETAAKYDPAAWLGLEVSREIIAQICSNGCIARFVVETRETENGREVYALLDANGKPAIGKKIDGTADWEILPPAERDELLTASGFPVQLKNIAEDFLYGTEDAIDGADLEDLYTYLLITNVLPEKADALALCYKEYLQSKERKARRRKRRVLLKELEAALQRGDTKTADRITDEIDKLEQPK